MTKCPAAPTNTPDADLLLLHISLDKDPLVVESYIECYVCPSSPWFRREFTIVSYQANASLLFFHKCCQLFCLSLLCICFGPPLSELKYIEVH